MQGYIEQQYRKCIYLVSMYLTFMEFFDIVYIVPLYSQPEVPRSLHLSYLLDFLVTQIPS